jgi:hypothetical protein
MVLGVGIALAGLPMYVIHHKYFIDGWFSVVGIITALVLIIAIVFVLKTKANKKMATAKR